MDAYWLEQTEADVPAVGHWLSDREKLHLSGLRFEKRQKDWILGRWTAKRALASFLNLPGDASSLRDIEICAALSGNPEVLLFNEKLGVSFSLSHSAGKALSVVAHSTTGIGCDLELVERRSDSFVTDFFTANEQTLIHQAPTGEQPAVATLLWSSKESALKALHVGLRLDTTLLEVIPSNATSHPVDGARADDCAGWSSLSILYMGNRSFHGCWRCADNMVRTVVFKSPQ